MIAHIFNCMLLKPWHREPAKKIRDESFRPADLCSFSIYNNETQAV